MKDTESKTENESARRVPVEALVMPPRWWKRYRIVKDIFAGFEVQIWRIYFPFWVELNFVNTHSSVDRAKNYLHQHLTKNKTEVVEYL